MVPYIDMHCDTLMKAFMQKKNDLYNMDGMVDIERLIKGNCMAQFFAIFMPPKGMGSRAGITMPTDEEYIEGCVTAFKNTISAHPDVFAQANNIDDINKNFAAKKVSGILTLEDGRAVEGSFENLERFFDMGIRLISFTWNFANCFGFPNSPDKDEMAKGLTEFGKEAVERMNEMGMLVDVSHLSDGGFWDVVDITKKPFVASHSNCRTLNPHPRSMTDDMIRAMADKGGVMGINFCPQFLTADIKNNVSTIQNLVDQIKCMVNVGGIDCAAVGTDLDGIGGTLEIGSADKMPLLFDALEGAGFTSDQIEKIAYKNTQRVIAETLK